MFVFAVFFGGTGAMDEIEHRALELFLEARIEFWHDFIQADFEVMLI